MKRSPEHDKHISKDELRYIQDSLGTHNNDTVVHPWKEIFTSKPVYAICASQFAENWGFYTMLTQLPSFLKGMILINSTIDLANFNPYESFLQIHWATN